MFITRRHTVAAALAAAAVTGGITACGGGSSSGTGAQTQPTAQPTASRPAVPVQNAATRQCLKAAGIKLPKAPAGGFNGTPPSNFTPPPNGTPPSNFTPPAGAGGLNNTKVQQALKACGISVPTPPAQ